MHKELSIALSTPLSGLFQSQSLPGFYDYAVDSLDICDSAGWVNANNKKGCWMEKKESIKSRE